MTFTKKIMTFTWLSKLSIQGCIHKHWRIWLCVDECLLSRCSSYISCKHKNTIDLGSYQSAWYKWIQETRHRYYVANQLPLETIFTAFDSNITVGNGDGKSQTWSPQDLVKPRITSGCNQAYLLIENTIKPKECMEGDIILKVTSRKNVIKSIIMRKKYLDVYNSRSSD